MLNSLFLSNVVVAFVQSKYLFYIGETGNLTCDIENIPDWNDIFITRTDGFVFLSKNRSNTTDAVLNGTELATDTTFEETRARVILLFDPVECGTMQDVYTCAVRTNDTWYNTTADITLQSE